MCYAERSMLLIEIILIACGTIILDQAHSSYSNLSIRQDLVDSKRQVKIQISMLNIFLILGESEKIKIWLDSNIFLKKNWKLFDLWNLIFDIFHHHKQTSNGARTDFSAKTNLLVLYNILFDFLWKHKAHISYRMLTMKSDDFWFFFSPQIIIAIREAVMSNRGK